LKKVIILGSTGSVGRSVLDVAWRWRSRIKVVGLAGWSSASLLSSQIEKFSPSAVALGSPLSSRVAVAAGTVAAGTVAAGFSLRKQRSSLIPDPRTNLESHLKRLSPRKRPKVYYGINGITQLIRDTDADIVFSCLVGTPGLDATLTVLRLGINIALANKEIMVMAGQHIMRTAARYGATVIPIDSEHSAIFQLLRGLPPGSVRRLILTASGGPFWKKETVSRNISPREALKHPTWKMGPKISVDSATMFNKGLEVIEAHHLFGLAQENIGLTVQRRSYIHGMVELVDGAILAYAAKPDMRLPIQFAMSYPEHWEGGGWGLELGRPVSMDLEPLDASRFPCLKIVLDAAHRGGVIPAAVSAADSVAVDAFLNGQLTFKDISRVLSVVVARTKRGPVSPSLLELRKADAAARRLAQSIIA